MCAASSSSRAAAADLSSAGAARCGALCGPRCCLLSSGAEDRAAEALSALPCLGLTLRAFQPTIRELQDVSREFRSTLEREIGIDEVPPSTNYRPTTTNNNEQPAANPNVKPEAAPYTSEELMKVTEEQIAASAAAAWNTQPAPSQEQEAAPPIQSTGAATSGGNDGPAAPAPATESGPSEANQSEKVESERSKSV
ncbi:hypothetical protein PVAP13_7KG119495 [Panicum virgatum]|uniref:Uncharacterized protein n=1 Tax=Panicum virgatum TaxID=38727 RepID=A0A8T0QD61_PANVG|nr:hypothetical protein PVAP13_7KG119495 [Panicum virgatum]